jgi:hypothetical protein
MLPFLFLDYHSGGSQLRTQVDPTTTGETFATKRWRAAQAQCGGCSGAM